MTVSTRRALLWVIGAVAIAVVVAGVAMVRRGGTSGRQPRLSREAANRQALFQAIQPVKVANCELERIGEPHDGGYALCANLLGEVKAGYSYGISGYDGWGCEISRRLRIPVHEYDCFNLTVPLCPDGTTNFHGECIGPKRGVEDGRPFDTFAGQFEKNGDAARRLVVKIDVEGAEWDSFLLAPDSVFQQIDQMAVEFHHVDEEKFVVTVQRMKEFFDIAHVHYNNFSCDPGLTPFPSWAFEVLFVNKRLSKTDGTPAPAGPLPIIDAPNNVMVPDCQARAGGPVS